MLLLSHVRDTYIDEVDVLSDLLVGDPSDRSRLSRESSRRFDGKRGENSDETEKNGEGTDGRWHTLQGIDDEIIYERNRQHAENNYENRTKVEGAPHNGRVGKGKE